MEMRWKNKVTKEIGLAYVTDNDTEILNFIGYRHASEDDLVDDDLEIVEVWEPCNSCVL